MANIQEQLEDALDFERFSNNISSIKMIGNKGNYTNLLSPSTSNADKENKDYYDTNDSIEIYRNFLDWLFSTFETTEVKFRTYAIEKLGLQKGHKVLITGCGLGEDAEICRKFIGSTSVVHGQDLSKRFVRHAAQNTKYDNTIFTVSSALNLPYKNSYFDAVYHFGGINLFGDLRLAIQEMNRVCKTGGRIVFGDESVAEHLRDTEFGKMVITNNQLWASKVPLAYIPITASNISLEYVLGNCFYLISFNKTETTPNININIPHIGLHGGSINTRYFGQLEGIDKETKLMLYAYAKKNNLQVSSLLSNMINEFLHNYDKE